MTHHEGHEVHEGTMKKNSYPNFVSFVVNPVLVFPHKVLGSKK
jgi:hypothetical protein